MVKRREMKIIFRCLFYFFWILFKLVFVIARRLAINCREFLSSLGGTGAEFKWLIDNKPEEERNINMKDCSQHWVRGFCSFFGGVQKRCQLLGHLWWLEIFMGMKLSEVDEKLSQSCTRGINFYEYEMPTIVQRFSWILRSQHHFLIISCLGGLSTTHEGV